MAKLIYFTPTSLYGYIADKNYDWAAFRESIRIGGSGRGGK